MSPVAIEVTEAIPPNTLEANEFAAGLLVVAATATALAIVIYGVGRGLRAALRWVFRRRRPASSGP